MELLAQTLVPAFLDLAILAEFRGAGEIDREDDLHACKLIYERTDGDPQQHRHRLKPSPHRSYDQEIKST